MRLRLPNVLVRAGEIHAPVRDDRERLALRLWWVPGWVFAAVTMAPALLAVAWLVPGAGMLLAGRLLPVPMVIMFVPLAVALCYFAMRRLPASWPRAGDADRAAGDQAAVAASASSGGASADGASSVSADADGADVDSVDVDGDVVDSGAAGSVVEGGAVAGSSTAEMDAARQRDVPAIALLAAVAIAAGFGVWEAAYASQQVFVASDPGVYLQYGLWIAGHGTVHIPASPDAFGSAQGLDFATTGFIVSGSSITPAYLPGLPLVLAAGSWIGGLGGALLMPAVLGGCAVLSFGGLVGRLCGAWWAVAAELVLALCLPEVYAARTPFSEPLVQLLLFGGLCLFVDSLVVRRRGFDAPGFGGPGFGSGDGVALAGLGGLALGLTVLASIGSLGTLLPAFPVLGLLFAARRPQAGPFGLGLILGIGTGLLAGLVLARPYLSTVSAQLHLIGLCAAGFGVATALVAPLAFPGARTWVRRTCTARLRFKWFGGEQVVLPSLGVQLAGLALVLPVAVLAALAVRPYLQTVRGQTSPAVIRQVETLQRLESLPVDGLRQYYESSLYWVFWYLGVPAVLLACAGAAVLGRRGVRAVFRARPSPSTTGGLAVDPAAESTREVIALWLLPFLIIVWSVLTVLWDPAVVPWQPLASHRLVSVVLPGLLLLAVWVSSRLTSRASLLGASRIAVALVAACCVLALAIPPLVTTFNPGLAPKPSTGRYSSDLAKFISRLQLRGIGTHASYGGSPDAASFLCAAIGRSASVLFVNEATAQSYAPVVRDLCGQPVAALVPAASSAAQLKAAATAIEHTGRHPILLGPTSASVTLPGTPSRPVIGLDTTGDAEELNGPPGGNWPVSYTLWLSAPAAAEG